MDLWIVLAIIVVLLLLLAAGGALARSRQLARTEGRFTTNLAQVNADQAAAHAQDRGWARETLDAAARAAFAEQRPGAGEPELTLAQIVDLPGTDEDKAIYRVIAGGRAERLTLGRRGGEWVFERLE
jgi:hypothetical protein